MLPPIIDLDHQPLVGQEYKIIKTRCEFDLYELHNLLKHNFLDPSDEMGLWDSLLPQFIFPQTHHFPEFFSWCQFRYIPSQRAVVAQNGDILFSITPKSINQMLKIPNNDSLSPFLVDSLMEIYKNLTFPQRAKIFEIFLPEDV